MNVYRFYKATSGEDGASPRDYIVSLVATNNEARYIYDSESQEDYGDRIELMAEAAERDGNLPTTPDEWADLAMYNLTLGVVKVLVTEIPEGSDVEIFEVEGAEIAFLDTVLIPERQRIRKAMGA